jgi:ParB family chromosome partitioning protein
MMKNVLRGGLKSLIPNRDIKDADEVLNELEDDELDQEEEVEDVVKKSKKVSIVSEDESLEEPAEAGDKGEVEQEKESQDEMVMPKKPQVTPLRIDTDDGEDLKLSAKKETKKKVAGSVSAKQVSIKSEVRQSKKTEEKQAERRTKKTEKDRKEDEDEIGTREPVRTGGDIWDKHEDDVQHIKVKDIAINPNQPRRKFDKAEMEDLKSSIAQHGILQPLVVRRMEEGMELVAGERRLRAAKELGWDKVPCVIRRDVSSGASRLELALIENIQREDLNPVEEALAYKQLNEEYGMTHEEIGERVGRSRVGVTNIIRVLQLPEEIQKGLIDEKISPGHAKAILMIPDDGKQLRFYRHLVEEGLSVRKAETRARRIQRTMRLDDPMRSKRRGRSAFEIKYSGVLEDRYGYNARLRFDEHKNRYEIVFKCYNKEEIDQLLGRLIGTEPLPADSQDQDVIESD